jgi:hypothetical protein
MQFNKLGGNFWTRLVPQVGHQNEAVKHAVVALGAAYQRMQLLSQHTLSSSSAESLVLKDLESFMIKQYNKAIHHLQQHISSASLENIEIILLCCLIFVCLEIAQGNQRQTIIHVSWGLQIIDTLLPVDLLRYSASSEDDPKSASLDRAARVCGYNSARVSQREWNYLLDRFCHLEFGAMVADSRVRPSMSLRFSEMGVVDERGLRGFKSAAEVHNAHIHWYIRVFGRMSQKISHMDDVGWWDDPEQIKMHEELLSWGRRLEQRFEEFLDGPYAPKPSQWAAYHSVSYS